MLFPILYIWYSFEIKINDSYTHTVQPFFESTDAKKSTNFTSNIERLKSVSPNNTDFV